MKTLAEIVKNQVAELALVKIKKKSNRTIANVTDKPVAFFCIDSECDIFHTGIKPFDWGANMARPRKNEEDKKDKRLTFYMTEEEQQRLNVLADHLGLEKTRIVAKALDTWIHTLENPPEPLKRAFIGKVVKSREEAGEGFVCSNGHPFWVDADWPSPPLCCPICADRHVMRTWAGRILRGF